MRVFSFSSLVVSLVLPTMATGQATGSLESLTFMSGCWRGDSEGGSVIEETYTSPSDNIMLGTTRYLRNGTTVMFEFTLITRDSSGIELLPYPRGRASEDGFRLTSVERGEAIFAAPEHDFPKRIIYRRMAADTIRARIDGGADSDQASEWQLHRVSCPGS